MIPPRPQLTPEQEAAIAETERKTRILESGKPPEEFLELVNELGPGMQGLTPGQLYLNWLWDNSYAIEEWSMLTDATTYCVGKIPVTEVAKTFFEDYRSAEYIYLDYDNQGFISELDEEQAKAAIQEIEKANEAYAAEEERMAEACRM